jgi:hypothetical protein
MNWVSQIGQAEKIRYASQYGEESYLRFILDNLGIGENGFYVDLGAASTSNTFYFQKERGFKGIMIDGDNKGNPTINEEWITAENIVELLRQYQCPESFALLSLDLDGNDYYILEKILQSEFMPAVIIAEINPRFEIDESFTIGYNPQHKFDGTDYYGMSLQALKKLAKRFNYEVVYLSDSLNAYLVQCELLPSEYEIAYDYQKKNDWPYDENRRWIEIK